MRREHIAQGQELVGKIEMLEARLERIERGAKINVSMSAGEYVQLSPAVENVVRMLAVSEMREHLAEYIKRLAAL